MLKSIPPVILCCLLLSLTSTAQNEPLEEVNNKIFKYMDKSVSPAEDFYQFVNGTWLKEAKIPEDRGRWGSFDELRKKTSNNTLTVIEEAANSDALDKNSPEYKAATFYRVAMDTSYLDKLGLSPVSDLLNQIKALNSKAEVFKFMTQNTSKSGNPFFVFFVRSDLNNSSMNTLYLSPSGLGMPERDYYMKEDDESIKTQEKYRNMLSDVFILEDKNADGSTIAQDIYELEKSLAGHRMTKEMQRNPDNINNPMSLEDAHKMFPAADFRQMLATQDIKNVDSLIVTDPGYFEGLNKTFEETQLSTLKNYMAWMVMESYKNYLGSDMEKTTFKFYGEELKGTKVMKPRWERVLDVTNRVLDQAVGRLYVEAFFPPEAKATAEELVQNVKESFGERIKDLDWMTEKTKEKALEKLSTFNVKIAYPDEWKDYSKLHILSQEEGGSYAGNIMRISEWYWAKKKSEINQPVDKSEWFMGPQIVNAYFSPSFNEIVFPAAILQAPFFDFQADPAVNYGGIGAVIGHEISHGFDDSGSKFDGSGNLNNWWTEDDRKAFEERTGALVAQFDAYKPFEDLAVNGEFTLGENIGDLGGINVAYQALKKHLAEHENPGDINGFTQKQRFFMSWATIWRTKYTDEALRTQIKTDPHAPGMYRAVGPVTNMDEFYEAFDVKEGDQMFKPENERVKIW